MATSLIRSRATITGVKDRFTWNEIKDGVVTLAEFMAQADRNFARCDINKDGRIDTAECRQALQRPRAER